MPRLKVNGADVEGIARRQRFCASRTTLETERQDHVFNFPCRRSIATGKDANAGDAPYASVSYGPLLFALPIADTKDANTPDPAAKWQFALDAAGR